MRIYIAGKITGLPIREYQERFMKAHFKLGQMGHVPINPIYLSVYGLPYEAYMEIDKILLSTCDAIYMLSNWEDSPGAFREMEYANDLGLEILYEQ